MNAELTAIDRAETLKYLAYRGAEPDEKISALMDKCEKRLISALTPKFCYRIFNIVQHSADRVSLENCSVALRGTDISAHLAGCEKAALLCATAGAGADSLIRTLQISDMTEAVITDAMAGSAVEQVCGIAEGELKKLYPDLFMTWRFSPGYGNFPIEQQTAFIDIINAARLIGVTASDSFVLTPKKSVTAVIGISSSLRGQDSRDLHNCEICGLRDRCMMRSR